ncbi:MAG: hypothetical protein JST00_44710 [Deltaproteobacteria bacterium]|nr:hypothetical protein [Deltaproteobacteria bacterium]
MYETAGALTIVERGSSLVWLVLLPILWTLVCGLAAMRSSGKAAFERLTMRLAIAAAGGTLGIAVGHAIRASDTPQRRVFEQHLGPVVRLGQLDLAIDLSRDPTSAALALLVAFLGLASVLHAVWTMQHRLSARLAWSGLATAGVMLVVLADAWPIVAIGLGLATIATWALAGGARPRRLGLALAGDIALVISGWILFWSLGGTFSASGFTPDPYPRFALVAVPDVVVPDGKAQVSLTTYADAFVTSDDGPPLPNEPLTAPFTVVLDPGVRSFRIQAGGATTDMLVTHVSLAAGHAYVLTPYGPTTSSRNAEDQVAVGRPTTNGPASLRAVLATRTIAGVPVATLIPLLVALAAIMRLMLLVRVERGGLAHALEAVAPLALALRVTPLLDPASGSAYGMVMVGAAFAVLFGIEAAGSSSVAAVPRAIAASLGAFSLAAAGLGEPAAALVIVVAASLGAAAAIAALEVSADVRWLGVACAGLAGLLPGAGTSSAVAATLAASLTAAFAGRLSGAFAALLLTVALMLVALATFRVYGASIRAKAQSTSPRGARVLVVVLATSSLLGGAALGTGTSPYGGTVAPLARRLVDGGGFDDPPRSSFIGLGLAIVASIAGLALARLATAKPGEPQWIGAVRAPSSAGVRGAGVAVSTFAFLARSVRVLDAEVLDDAIDLVTSVFARIGAGAAPAQPGVPTRGDHVRTGILAALLLLLAIVVISAVVVG